MSKQLDQKIREIENKLVDYPDGKLVCTKNRAKYKWYQSDGKNLTYIPRKNRLLAEMLASKKYLSALLADLYGEQKAIHAYLKHCNPQSGKSNAILNTPSEYQSLLSAHFAIPSTTDEWLSAPFLCNSNYPEQLIHRSLSGNVLRSKSEVIIDLSLFTNHIPFRYECALTLGDLTFFPDFTIKHPKTGEIFYWEHFGMMDNATYAKNAYSKLQCYTSNGIVPSINLITTYETKSNPLSSELVEHIIDHYFL